MSHRVPNPTRLDVLGAVARCHEMGVERFCATYGYAPAPRARFVLRVCGKSYPAKAILGVASGLAPRDFSGGAGHACRVLRRLGFTIREGRPRGLDAEISALARSLAFPFGPLAAPELPVEPVAYFASGSNHAGEIRALADLGHDVGVSAREIGPTGIDELIALAGTDVQVFVDSGAFGERCRKTFELVKPMVERDWERVLALYERLAEVLGDQLHVVAPDRVGCQTTTLELLLRYRDRIRALHARGARVLVAVQKGARSQADFYRRCCEILGFEPIPALPCRKAATTINEAVEFAAVIQPRLIHLLGIGIRSPKAFEYLYRVSLVSGAQIQMDAVAVAAMVGRDGVDGAPRRLTAAQDLAAQLATTCARMVHATWRKYLGLVLALGGVGATA